MCGVCGLLGGEDDWGSGVQRQRDGAPATRRAERAERIRVLNEVLRPLHVKVSDIHGRSFLLGGATGKQQIADDIGHLWQAVREMTGCGIDPLAPLEVVDRAGPR